MLISHRKMAAPTVRMQISAGVGSGENKKLKMKSIFVKSSRKFRPKKKKVQKRLEEISVSFYSIVLCLQKWTHTYTHMASNLPNSQCWTTQAAEFLPLFTLE